MKNVIKINISRSESALHAGLYAVDLYWLGEITLKGVLCWDPGQTFVLFCQLSHFTWGLITWASLDIYLPYQDHCAKSSQSWSYLKLRALYATLCVAPCSSTPFFMPLHAPLCSSVLSFLPLHTHLCFLLCTSLCCFAPHLTSPCVALYHSTISMHISVPSVHPCLLQNAMEFQFCTSIKALLCPLEHSDWLTL